MLLRVAGMALAVVGGLMSLAAPEVLFRYGPWHGEAMLVIGLFAVATGLLAQFN